MVKKRGDKWYIEFRFNGKFITSVTEGNKRDAEKIEHALKSALRSGDYLYLDPDSRRICVQVFRKRGWEMPASLIAPEGQPVIQPEIQEELTLWKAMELCLKYPEVKNSPNRLRMKQCFVNLAEKLGKHTPLKEIRIPQIKQYRIDRLNEGTAPATVNKEKSFLSKMFQVLIEMELIDNNPARMVRNLSEKSGERQVYVSFKDFNIIASNLPEPHRSIATVAYYTGMRRGEITGLTRKQVSLTKRLIYLGAQDTKEGRRKRVPIHKDLIPVFENVMKVRAIGSDLVFLIDGERLCHGAGRRCWEAAVADLKLETTPRFHDLRHTWKTNARRSGMDSEIRERIMGHVAKTLSVSERYGSISDQELIRAIELLTFDHGDTEIWVAGSKRDSKVRVRKSKNCADFLASV